ncbi:hypothetical protein DFP97_1229 [Paenibacillus prosopidis]|uniref:Uncharacterized protein n=1 Tax=Paenibacillus prosopidis TaxID=630520 RepID=A0A368VJ44_9BACL|nr:hypothetical protein DFP97_1229 [Paenibacillus prosopidis]
MKNPDWQCGHFNLWYENGSLVFSDCKKRGFEQYLEDSDFPACSKKFIRTRTLVFRY